MIGGSMRWGGAKLPTVTDNFFVSDSWIYEIIITYSIGLCFEHKFNQRINKIYRKKSMNQSRQREEEMRTTSQFK